MKCLVTAGPTYEPLDRVRRITNLSTGRLGVELALGLQGQGHAVTLLRGELATHPLADWRGGLETFTTVADLQQRLQSHRSDPPHALFHAAAVSDFAPGRTFRPSGSGGLEQVEAGKIPSRLAGLLTEWVPTPKLIARLRDWFPEAILVGWKYEVDGGREQACAAGLGQWREHRLTATVVNGPAYGEGFGVIRGEDTITDCADREALFACLTSLLG